MVTGTKALLDVARTAQAVALANENLKLTKKKKVTTKKIVGTGVKNIVGISLIKSQADLAALL